MSPASDSPLVRFGRVIRQERHLRDLTQEALATLAGVDPTQVSRVECATKDVQMSTMFRLINALEMTPGELYAAYDALKPTPTRD